MATFVLIPGAGCDPWYWTYLTAELTRRGHDAVPVDLPCDDDAADFEDYAAAAVDAAGGRSDLVVVAHSLGGFTGPLMCERVPVRLLVLLTAMIPRPGEPAADWWANTGYPSTDADFDTSVLQRRLAGPGGRLRKPFPAAVRHADGSTLAAHVVAGHADAFPAVPRRPVLSGGIHASGGSRPARHRSRRDAGRPHGHAVAAGRARRPARRLPGHEPQITPSFFCRLEDDVVYWKTMRLSGSTICAAAWDISAASWKPHRISLSLPG